MGASVGVGEGGMVGGTSVAVGKITVGVAVGKGVADGWGVFVAGGRTAGEEVGRMTAVSRGGLVRAIGVPAVARVVTTSVSGSAAIVQPVKYRQVMKITASNFFVDFMLSAYPIWMLRTGRWPNDC